MRFWFPKIYEGESLYSALGRYQIYYRLSTKELHRRLFGNQSLSAIPDFPTHINALCERTWLGLFYSPKEIVSRFSVYNCYSKFLEPVRGESILNLMLSGDGRTIKRLSRAVKQNSLFYCPICLKEDMQRVGESYWHLNHQLPGISSCPEHHIKLLSECHLCGMVFEALKFDFVKLQVSCPRCHAPLDNKIASTVEETNYAKDVINLMSCNQTFSPELLIKKYSEKIKEKELKSRNGGIDYIQLEHEFNLYYSQEFLIATQSNLKNDKSIDWIKAFLRRTQATMHPIHHLLLIRYLFGSFEQFVDRISVSRDNNFSDKRNANKYSCRSVKRSMEKHREKILKAIDTLPSKFTRTDLINKEKHSYCWLLNNDADWLISIIPQNIKLDSKKTHYRVKDWNKIDIELSEKLTKLPQSLGYINGKPVRITRALIARTLGLNIFQTANVLERLPRTKGYLDAMCETLECLRMRRIDWAINELISLGKDIMPWRIREKAGINKINSERIDKYIKSKLIKTGVISS